MAHNKAEYLRRPIEHIDIKVATTNEQMVFGEATVTMPLIVGYAYHGTAWRERPQRRLADRCVERLRS